MKTETKKRIYEKAKAAILAGDISLTYVRVIDDRLAAPHPVYGFGRSNIIFLPDEISKLASDDYIAELKSARQAELDRNAELSRIRREEEEKKLAAHRDERVWGLTGLYIEESTGPRWTLRELEAFRDWSGYLRLKYPASSEIHFTRFTPNGDDIVESYDESARWEDVCNYGPPYHSFRDFVRELEKYTKRPYQPTTDESLEKVGLF
jgi:hypothetical protein